MTVVRHSASKAYDFTEQIAGGQGPHAAEDADGLGSISRQL